MMYSVEDRVGPPRGDEQRYAAIKRGNKDLEPEASGGFSQYNSSNHGGSKPTSETNLKQSINGVNKLRESSRPQQDSDKDEDSGSIAVTSKVKKTPVHVDKKSIHSKQSSVSKIQKSRISHRRGSSTNYEANNKTGAVSIAMQILNMDEDEKE